MCDSLERKLVFLTLIRRGSVRRSHGARKELRLPKTKWVYQGVFVLKLLSRISSKEAWVRWIVSASTVKRGPNMALPFDAVRTSVVVVLGP